MSAAAERDVLPEVHRRLVGRATLGDQLRRHARTQPTKIAFISYGAARREWSYRELDESANGFAHALLARGARRGDRVACMARNGVEVVIAYYAALKIGAAFTGINALYRGPEVLHQLQHAEPTVVVADAEFTGLIDELRPQLGGTTGFVAIGEHDPPPGWESFGAVLAASPPTEPEVDVDERDLAMLVYTSGTEAEPKGVMIPHRNYLISTAPAWSWGVNTGADDVWLFVMPFHTIAGLGSMTTLTQLGATLVLPDSPEPARCLEIIGNEQVTVIAQTPTFYLALCRQPGFGPHTVGAVRRCMTYGGQVSPHTIDAWAAAAPGAIWGTYWGQSELSQLGSVGWFRTLADIPDGDPSWIGKPVTHLEIRVVDAAGNDAEIGELLCRTPSVMLGYFKDPERTEQVFDGDWIRTGDMVRIDPSGNLFFYDRAKDVIKSGGMNVSSQEVERVLHAHPDVARAAVVGLADDYWSEAVTAFVIARAGASVDPAAVIDFCREQLAVYKAPKAVHVVDEFPLDPQGKILKRQLRDHRAAAGSTIAAEGPCASS